MLVNEIFGSIEGEGIRTGYPVTFIRLFGCNLHCSYCDTRYACTGPEFIKMSVDNILQVVKGNGWKRVTLTGGEPLIHRDVDTLIQALVDAGYEVNIETNGSVPIFPYLGYDNVILTVDYKSPSSGENHEMCISNLERLREQDVLKFVVGSEEDLYEMERVLENYKVKCHVFVSPIFGSIEPADIADFIKNHKLHNCRMQLQIHKFIWEPTKRGV